MVTTREVSVDDANTVADLVAALLAELGPDQGEAGLDIRLVADLLAKGTRPWVSRIQPERPCWSHHVI